MDVSALIFITSGLGCFSLGYSLAMYLSSKCYIRDRVSRLLKKEMDARCKNCQALMDAEAVTTEFVNRLEEAFNNCKEH